MRVNVGGSRLRLVCGWHLPEHVSPYANRREDYYATGGPDHLGSTANLVAIYEKADSATDADSESEKRSDGVNDYALGVLRFGSFLMGFGVCALLCAWVDGKRCHRRNAFLGFFSPLISCMGLASRAADEKPRP